MTDKGEGVDSPSVPSDYGLDDQAKESVCLHDKPAVTTNGRTACVSLERFKRRKHGRNFLLTATNCAMER